MNGNNDFLIIGEQILNQNIAEDDSDLPRFDQIYAKCLLLSQLLLSFKIESFDDSISTNKQKKIEEEINGLVDLLRIENKLPTKNIGSKSSEFEALSILSFASLLLLRNGNEDTSSEKEDSTNKDIKYDELIETNSQNIIEIEKLKKENFELSKYQKEYYNIINMIKKKFKLPSSSEISDVMCQLTIEKDDDDVNKKEVNQNDVINYLLLKLNLPEDSKAADIICQIEANEENQKRIVGELKKNNFSNQEVNDLFLNDFLKRKDDENDLKKFLIEKFDLNEDKEILAQLKTLLPNNRDDELIKFIYNTEDNSNNSENVEVDQKNDKESILYVLNSEIESLKKTLSTLNIENNDLRGKYKLFKKLVIEKSQENKEKTTLLAELSLKINELSLQMDKVEKKLQIETENRRNKEERMQNSQNIENDCFYSTLELLSSQIEQQSNELTDISESRNKLFEIFQTQTNIIECYEQILCKINLQNKLQSIVADNNEEFQNDSNSLRYVLNIIKEKYNNYLNEDQNRKTENSYMQIIENIEMKESERIIDTFSYLLNENKIKNSCIKAEKENGDKKVKRLNQSYKTVCEYLTSLFTFLDNMTNSSDTLDWIVKSENKDEIRDTLSTQIRKIDSFLKERQIDLTGYDFIQISERIKEDQMLNEYDDNDDILFEFHEIKAVFLVIDLLKKYSSHLEDRIETLNADLNNVKNELYQSEISLNDAKSALFNSQYEGNNREMLQNVDSDNNEEEEENPKESLGNHLNNIQNENLFLRKNLEKIMIKYKKCRQVLKIVRKDFDQKKNDEDIEKAVLLSHQIENSHNNETEIYLKKIEKLETEDKELRETLSNMTKRLSQFEVEKDSAITKKVGEIEKNFEEKIKEIMIKNDLLQKELQKSTEDLNKTEIQQSNEYDTLQKENSELLNKLEKVRLHYETILQTYKEKQNNFDKIESDLINSVRVKNEKIKKISKDLGEAKIEAKMSVLKMKSLEEKLMRNEQLHRSQISAVSVNFESLLTEKLQKIEIENEDRNRQFLLKICELLKDFIDFSQKISEENCLKMIKTLVSKLSNQTNQNLVYEKQNERFNEMRKVLHAKSDSEVVTKVSLFADKLLSFEKHKNEIDCLNEISENLDFTNKMLSEWKLWAKRLLSIVTDSFFNETSVAFTISPTTSASKYEKEEKEEKMLQSRIEEKMLMTIGNRKIFRRIEILRKEKFLLQNFKLNEHLVNNIPNSASKPSLLNVVCVVLAGRRIQKITGKLPGNVFNFSSNSEIEGLNKNPLPNFNGENYNSKPKAKQSRTPTKRPIISFS